MSKFIAFLCVFTSMFALKIEVPCLLVQDFATHRIYLKIEGCEYDIWDIEHSVNCDCSDKLIQGLTHQKSIKSNASRIACCSVIKKIYTRRYICSGDICCVSSN